MSRFSLGAWVTVGTAAFWFTSLVNVTFRKSNSLQHVLVAWRPGACVTAILIPSLVLLLEYTALDDMATFWFFHHVRCYPLV